MPLVAKPVYQQVEPARRALAGLPATVDAAALAAFGCDVSFMSDDSTPPDELIARQVERAPSPAARNLLCEAYDRIRADYDFGDAIGHPARVFNRVRQAMAATNAQPTSEQYAALLRFFEKINLTLFQHQTLDWLADGGFKVHLYGAGWERHPTFARLARGPVRNAEMRQAICAASQIQLAAGAYGVVTSSLLETIATGGFVLMRYCPADVIERFYPPLHAFCAAERITTNAELAERATPGIRALMAFASRTLGIDLLNDWAGFVQHLSAVRAAGRSRSASVLWPAQYGAVSFGSRDQLLGLTVRYLYDVPERRRIAEAMRGALAAHAGRVQVQVNRRVASGDAAAASHDEVAA